MARVGALDTVSIEARCSGQQQTVYSCEKYFKTLESVSCAPELLHVDHCLCTL